MRKIITAAVAAVSLMVAGAVWVPVSAAASASPGPLDYYGGDLAARGDSPAVALIFWGPWWTTTSGGKAAANEMHQLFYGIGTPYTSTTEDPWSRTLTQYWEQGCPADPNKQPCNPPMPRQYVTMTSPALTWCSTVDYASPCFDSHQPPAQPTGQQIGAEISKWDGEPTMNVQGGAIYALFLPPKVVPYGETSCAYHTYHRFRQAPSGNYYYVPVMVVPYQMATISRCNAGLGAAAGLSISAAHEFAEAVTDPFGGISTKYAGWATSTLNTPTQQEIADLCEGVPVFSLKLPTGTFELPQLWSLTVGHCVKTS